MKKAIVTAFALCTLSFPLAALAFPFGGSIGQIVFCYNNAIYAQVGPPRGGPYIWTPSTKTYQFGPPSHTGQWLLGLAAPPYYCLVSIQPIIVWSGILMTMEGSSGPAAPGSPGGLGFGGGTGGGFSLPTLNPSPSPAPTQSTGIGHLVISELYYRADASHGGAAEDQWIEVYNPLSTSVDVSGWTVVSASSSQPIPAGTILSPNSYLIFAGTASVRTIWNIPLNVKVLAFPNAFTGFVASGDHAFLQNSSGARVDALSYGTDISAFSPPVPVVQLGHSVSRKNLSTDTDSASDWQDSPNPSPGR